MNHFKFKTIIASLEFETEKLQEIIDINNEKIKEMIDGQLFQKTKLDYGTEVLYNGMIYKIGDIRFTKCGKYKVEYELILKDDNSIIKWVRFKKITLIKDKFSVNQY